MTDIPRMRAFSDQLDSELCPPLRTDGPTAIDLFAGAGGLTIGLKAAGFNTIAAVEVDPPRVVSFLRHTPTATVITSDIRQVDFSPYRGRVQLVYGGPPCQPFSSGGLRKASKDRRDMIPEFLRAVSEMEPAAVLMENVPGLVAGDRLDYLNSVLERLEDAGYSVAWRVVNAADYGVPQKRRRLIVVGIKNQTFQFPTETHGPGRRLPHVATREVLSDEPNGLPNAAKVFYARNPDLRPSPYDGHLFNGGGRPINLDEPCHTVLASAGGNKTHFLDTLGLVPKYHRHLIAGGHPGTGTLRGARRLTVEESALIQTFPTWIKFNGPRSVQYQQVGDAVPPLLGLAIGRALMEQMSVRPSAAPTKSRRLQTKALFDGSPSVVGGTLGKSVRE